MKALKTHLLLAAATVVAGSALLLPSAAFASGDVNRPQCPNEASAGFTPSLPDCRAYERVTPAETGGFQDDFLALLDEGEQTGAVLTQSIGRFEPATGFFSFLEYSARRGASGWLSSSVADAPLDRFEYPTENATANVENAAGSEIISLREKDSSVFAYELYRHAEGGPYEPVGSVFPPGAHPGAPTGSNPGRFPSAGEPGVGLFPNPSLTHILFTVDAHEPAERWPGDTTVADATGGGNIGSPSLYEYTEPFGGPPALVGVTNSGELISQCGTGPGGVAFNGAESAERGARQAISESGDVVFFTVAGHDGTLCPLGAKAPPVAELYARIAGTTTLAISEPAALPGTSDPQCREPRCISNETSEAAFRDARYEGAARDGSAVFFTSTQQLTDGATQDQDPADTAGEQEQSAQERPGCSSTQSAGGCNLYEYVTDPSVAHTSQGLHLLSAASDPRGAEVQGVSAIAGDGSRVYFVAKGVLTQAPNEYGESAQYGADNLYTTDAQTDGTSFIASLAPSDLRQWRKFGGRADVHMQTTESGRYLLFTSLARLTPGDQATEEQLFRYDAESGALLRVSEGAPGLDQSGAGAHGAAVITPGPLNDLWERAAGVGDDEHPALASNGAVVFSIADALTPDATEQCVRIENGACSVYQGNGYLYENGNLYLIGAGAARDSVGEMAISPSGSDVFLYSSENLAGDQQAPSEGIYDARVEGGFAQADEERCIGEDCQGAFVPSPSPAAPTSTGSGSGNIAPPVILAPRPSAPTRALKLEKALKVCHADKKKGKRVACEKTARKRYGLPHKANAKGGKR